MKVWRARRRRVFGMVLGLALATAAVGPASAQPTREDRAAATALFDEGRKLAADKKYAEACPKFEAAMRLDPGMGTLFNLSDCHEQIGRTASAWSGFRDVAAQAKAEGQPDREKAARDRAAALEPKLSKVRLMVPAELAGLALTITRDGSPVPAALVGTAIPLDPGPHTLRVTAEGKEPWETKITVGVQGGVVDVPVPVLAAKKADGPAVATATVPVGTASGAPSASAVVTAAPSATVGDAPVRPWQKPLGITAAVAGVLGLGAGVALGVVAKGTYDESNKANCDAVTHACNAEGDKMRKDAVAMGNIGTVVGIAGAVIGAAGIVLWIVAPSAPAAGPVKSASKSGDKSASWKSVRVGASPGGVVIRGQF